MAIGVEFRPVAVGGDGEGPFLSSSSSLLKNLVMGGVQGPEARLEGGRWLVEIPVHVLACASPLPYDR